MRSATGSSARSCSSSGQGPFKWTVGAFYFKASSRYDPLDVRRFYFAVWRNNLTNVKSRANATKLAFGNHVVSFNPPRTYGVTGGFGF